MYRGTTAQLVFKLPEAIILDEMTEIWITVSTLSGKRTFKLTEGKIEVVGDESKLVLNLEQEDTLKLSVGPAKVQIRMTDGTNALCTNICEFMIKKILQDGVIE